VTTTSGSDVDSRQGRLTALTTPRSAALAGVAFVLLFSASMVLLRMSIPEDPVAGTALSRLGPDAPRDSARADAHSRTSHTCGSSAWSAASHHLETLVDAGILTRERRGT
jgi:DNA-binding transcriptional ArsR family regulator